jgi:hypothetical protein
MYRKYFLVAVLTAFLVSPACADLQGFPGSPSFTREELVIINRNASLVEISKTNPWIVRRILDALEKAEHDSAVSQPPSPSSQDGEDPDLDRMERASPEAVHDLLQLLKQAGQKR